MNLVVGDDVGINHGYPQVQVAQAVSVVELKLLTMPAQLVRMHGDSVTYFNLCKLLEAAALEETVDWIGGILELENNISCDNPLLFELENGEYEAVMGCNCSNTQVGYAMDLLGVIMAELGEKLQKEQKSLILWQRLATLAMQISADSIPTTGGQEDHVEFSYSAAEKAVEGVAVLKEMLKQ